MWDNDDSSAPPKYKESYLQKKEGDKKWEEYWVVLRGIYLIFYIHKSSVGEIIDKFCGCITLNAGSKCIAAKRKNYSFPFYLLTNKGKYLFKTNSNIDRHQWFNVIELAAQGKPPPDHLGFLHRNNENNDDTHDVNQENVNEDDTNTTRAHHHESNEHVEEESNKREEEEEDVYFAEPTPCVVINIQQGDNNKERRFLEDSSFEDDGLITELDQNQELLMERYREIYCNEVVNEKMEKKNDNTTAENDEKVRQVSSYGYPKAPINHLSAANPHDRITRLTKSADSLRGMSFSSSYDTLQASENSSHKKNLQTRTKNIFSRHLVGSAPEVKSVIPRNGMK